MSKADVLDRFPLLSDAANRRDEIRIGTHEHGCVIPVIVRTRKQIDGHVDIDAFLLKNAAIFHHVSEFHPPIHLLQPSDESLLPLAQLFPLGITMRSYLADVICGRNNSATVRELLCKRPVVQLSKSAQL